MFEPIKNEKLYKMVVNQVKGLIAEGALSPGDRLPPERELATMLTVSRASVRQAISALEALGVLESRHGEGTFIAKEESHDDLIESFTKILVKEQITPEEIIETRRIIECPNVRLCAERASGGQIEQIRLMLEENRMKVNKGASLSEMNRDFHISIAEGTCNRSLVKITEALYKLMEINLWPRLKDLSEQRPERTKKHLVQHEAIWDAIKSRDGELAAKRMQEHLDTIEAEFEEDALENGHPGVIS